MLYSCGKPTLCSKTSIKRTWIPKEDGRQRPIGILILEDKIVQKAVSILLEAVFEVDFYDFSYGFRPKRNSHQALHAIRELINTLNIHWILDLDIQQFFDSIRKQLLMELVQRRDNDPRVIRLLWKWLDAGVMDDGQYFKADAYETPQGSVISPLLANIYLHAFDKMFQLSGISGTLIRYADDFVILLRGNGQAMLD